MGSGESIRKILVKTIPDDHEPAHVHAFFLVERDYNDSEAKINIGKR